MMHRLRWLAIFLLVALVAIAVQMRSVPHVQAFQAGDADGALSAYTTGLYDTSAKYFYADTTRASYNDFWKEAMSWNVIMDAYARTMSSPSRQMIDDVYDGFMARNPDMATACNTANSFTLSDIYNDDVGWWANASIRAYELTGERRYEHCAQRLFDTIYASWDTSSYGGGIWWTRSHPTQKNVATNAPAVITAAKLAAALGNSSYLTKAKQIYAWVIQALTNGAGTVYDDDTNGTRNTVQLTYNYGAVIGAADALYHATTEASYLAEATTVATTSLTKVTRDGILQDEGSGDGGEFKGIYAQYLAELTDTYHQSQYTGFLQKNASVAWANRRSPDNLVGTNWEVAAPSGTLTTSTATSAVAMLQVVPADTVVAYQAENGTLHNLTIASIHSGYHGSGYITGWNKDGQWVDFAVTVPTAGTYRLIVRYAAGGGTASRYIYANGHSVINNQGFPSTGSWGTYSTSTLMNVSLNAKSNTISVLFNSSKGSANSLNLDELTVVAQ